MKKIKYRMCLVFVVETFRVILDYPENIHITYIIYITLMVTLFFEAYKKI